MAKSFQANSLNIECLGVFTQFWSQKKTEKIAIYRNARIFLGYYKVLNNLVVLKAFRLYLF